MIAGGLGERLGYSGIKIDLPVTVVHPNYSYIQFYIKYVNACCERALKVDPTLNPDKFYIPFCIMTSDDTYQPTIDLLEKNNYFGYKKGQIDIIKQENVPALIDNNARIALNSDKTKIITKPHGHGDVHNLLYQSGVAKKWKSLGKEWMVFIQDTNALAIKTIPSILGVSRQKNWLMNSVCVPRKPG